MQSDGVLLAPPERPAPPIPNPLISLECDIDSLSSKNDLMVFYGLALDESNNLEKEIETLQKDISKLNDSLEEKILSVKEAERQLLDAKGYIPKSWENIYNNLKLRSGTSEVDFCIARAKAALTLATLHRCHLLASKIADSLMVISKEQNIADGNNEICSVERVISDM